MFQTAPAVDEGEDGYADVFPVFHAAARCLSGGPVCITDAPGRHDLELIRQISGRTTRGKTVVFRPSVVGRALDVYNLYLVGISDRALLKIGAYHGKSGTGTGIVGVFNLEETRLTEILPLKKFPGVVEGQKYVVRSHSSSAVTAPLEVSASPTAGSLLEVSLDSMGCDILSAYPLHAVESKTRGRVLLANLGLIGKMTGSAAVAGTVFEVRDNGRMVVEASSKALGVVGKCPAHSPPCLQRLTRHRHLHLNTPGAGPEGRFHGDNPWPTSAPPRGFREQARRACARG